MALTIEEKDAILRLRFAGPLWLGLLVAGGTEEDDSYYQRQPLLLGADGLTDRMANVEEVRFPPYAARSVLTGWVIFGQD